jgi:hypothetical protein
VQYVKDKWIQSVQGYLKHIQGSIFIPHKPTLQLLREHDIPNMSAPNHSLTISDLQEINVCRLFLQVTSLAEIANHARNSIFLQCAIKDTINTNGNPFLWQISNSNLKWPEQTYPSTQSWKKWKKILQGHLDCNSKINNRCEGGFGLWTLPETGSYGYMKMD